MNDWHINASRKSKPFLGQIMAEHNSRRQGPNRFRSPRSICSRSLRACEAKRRSHNREKCVSHSGILTGFTRRKQERKLLIGPKAELRYLPFAVKNIYLKRRSAIRRLRPFDSPSRLTCRSAIFPVLSMACVKSAD